MAVPKRHAESVNGIRTYFRKWDDSLTWFESSYSVLSNLCKGFYFFDEKAEGSFQFPYDDETRYENYVSACVSSTKERRLYKADFLFENMDIVSDDWNSILLIDSREFRDHLAIEKILYAENVTFPPMRKMRILYIRNFDGSFWEFYTNDQGLIDRYLEVHSTNKNFDLRYVEMKKHFPDPASYRDDFPPRVID